MTIKQEPTVLFREPTDVDDEQDFSDDRRGDKILILVLTIKTQSVRGQPSTSNYETSKKLHVCAVCNKSFISLFNLKMHQMVHTQAKLHECDVCKKISARLNI